MVRQPSASLEHRTVALVAMLLLLFAARPLDVRAATIQVNSVADAIEDTGSCTLREAIIAANTDTASGTTPGECSSGSGADTINVPSGTYVLSIAGAGENLSASGDLDILGDVVIAGSGQMVVVDANQIDRVVEIGGPVTVEIVNMTITGGANVFSGGGIYLRSGGSLTLVDSTVAGNSATAGGGIDASFSTLTLTSCTVSGNSATDGGAITAQQTPLTLTNSTVSGNSASNSLSGIVTYSTTTNLINCTVSDNPGTGISNQSDGTVILTNSLIDGVCNASPTAVTTSNGGNLESPGDTCGLTDSSDQVEVSAPQLNLGPLADNGGPTRTHALLLGSLAIDAGSNGACPLVDQRGVPRVDGACDVGAYERVEIFFDGFEAGNTSLWTNTVGET